MPVDEHPLLSQTSQEAPSLFQWGSWMNAQASEQRLVATLTDDLDPNHNDGFGTLQLVGYVYLLGEVDLRDAELSFTVQGTNFVANDADFFVWAQGCDYQDHYARGFECGNWALSSQPMVEQLESGGLEHVTVKLTDDIDYWSAGGAYRGQGFAASRYRPLPLSRVLGDPVNLHFVLALPYEGKPATGQVSIGDVKVCPAEQRPLGPIITSAVRIDDEIRLRIRPLGYEATVQVWQNDHMVQETYAGMTRRPRDVRLRGVGINLCDEAEVQIASMPDTTRTIIPRHETTIQRLRRGAYCARRSAVNWLAGR